MQQIFHHTVKSRKLFWQKFIQNDAGKQKQFILKLKSVLQMENILSFINIYNDFPVSQHKPIFLKFATILLMTEFIKPISQCLNSQQIDWNIQLKIQSRTQSFFKQKPFRTEKICFDIQADDLQLVYRLKDPAYQRSSNLLANTKITKFDRQKLKSWILSQTQNYKRQSYVTASYFLDMFFMHKQKIGKNQFQILGLACLILATKMTGEPFPQINYMCFQKNKLLNFEKVLLKTFKHKINPVTYVQITQQLLTLWDSYLNKKNSFRSVKYTEDDQNCIRRTRAIFQTLDCLDLVIDSLDIQLIDLVFATFFLEHRRFCILQFGPSQYARTYDFVQDAQFAQFSHEYVEVMLNFLKDLKTNVLLFKDLRFDDHIIGFVLQFSRMRPKIKVKSYYKLKRQISRQTYNAEITEMAQRYQALRR